MSIPNAPDNKIPILLYNWFGTFQVYTVATEAEIHANLPPSNYYWRDAASPQGFGPFPNLVELMNHYAEMLKMTHPKNRAVLANGKKPGQLIRVDFQNRRKVVDS